MRGRVRQCHEAPQEGPPHISTTGLSTFSDLPTIGARMRAGCDVEIQINDHAVAVVGWAKLADGRYALQVSSDDKQGHKGGTKGDDGWVEPLLFDPRRSLGSLS